MRQEAGEGSAARHGHEEGAGMQLQLHQRPLHLIAAQASSFCSQSHLHCAALHERDTEKATKKGKKSTQARMAVISCDKQTLLPTREQLTL